MDDPIYDVQVKGTSVSKKWDDREWTLLQGFLTLYEADLLCANLHSVFDVETRIRNEVTGEVV